MVQLWTDETSLFPKLVHKLHVRVAAAVVSAALIRVHVVVVAVVVSAVDAAAIATNFITN